MIPSWVGTIMVAMMNSISALRPRNRSLAKANPASEEKNTTEMVTTPATIAELISPLRKIPFSAASTRETLSMSWSSGRIGGTVLNSTCRSTSPSNRSDRS